MGQPLPDTKITANEIEKWMTDYYDRPIKIKTRGTKKIAAGQGFTSTILRIFLEYDDEITDDSKSLPKSVVLKTPSLPAMEELIKKMNAGDQDGFRADDQKNFIISGHKQECQAYKIFGKHPPIPIPIIYAATECKDGEMGAIIMEDFSDRAGTIGDPTVTLLLEQALSAAEAVASWHAWCMTTTGWQDSFLDVVGEERKQMFGEFAKMMVACFENGKKNYPNAFDKLDMNKVMNRLSLDEFSKRVERHRKIIPDVIVHGDFYAPNLLFEKTKDAAGNVEIGSKLVGIIDWPMSFRGCGLDDFSRLLTVSLDTITRREHSTQILKHYYDHLTKKLESTKIKLGSFDEILKVYDDYFVNAGLFFVLMLDWLQNIWVTDTGEEKEKKRKILFDRCHAIYEDILPLLEKM